MYNIYMEQQIEQSNQNHGSDLMGVGELLSKSIKGYQDRFTNLLPFAIIFGLASLVPIVNFLFLFPAVAIFLWISKASVEEGKEFSKDIFGTFKKAFHYFFPLLWAAILTGLVVFGGFALLIVPGIMLSILVYVSPAIVVHENLRGVQALQKSWHYISGRKWKVFLRLVVFSVVAIIATLAFQVLFGFVSSYLATFAINVLVIPFAYVFVQYLYADLAKSRMGDTPAKDTPVYKKRSLIMLLTTILGALMYVLVLSLIGFGMFYLFNSGVADEVFDQLENGGEFNFEIPEEIPEEIQNQIESEIKSQMNVN